MMTRRKDHPAELDPRAVYRVLAPLQVGDAVPPQVYVSDYRDGEIPDWRIHHREERDGLVLLVAFDHTNAYRASGEPAAQLSLFDDVVRYPAARILSSSRKTLRSPIVEYSGLDGWPNMLCDMLQQAKIAAKR